MSDSLLGQVQLWNTNTMTRKYTLNFDWNSKPWHIINSPNTNRVYVALKGHMNDIEYPDSDGVACLSYYPDSLHLEWLEHSDEFIGLHGIDISNDGQKLFVSGRIDGKLHVLDTQDGTVLQSIELGHAVSSQPVGVAYYSN